MHCIVDLVKEGSAVLAYLPFDVRKEFQIQKGSVYAKCEIGGVPFETKLLSRGEGRFCVFFNKALLKNLALSEDAQSVVLNIEPRAAEQKASQPQGLLQNETLQTIAARRSIRAFTGEDVSEDALNTVLNAGFCAPSASNKRPLHFLVSKDRAKMDAFMAASPYVGMLKTAATSIVVCGDKVTQGIPEWLLEDCAAATENMLLAIVSLGLGGCWCGVRQGSDFYKAVETAFCLPGHIRPVSLIAVGVPAEEKAPNDCFNSARVHMETW
jgi:nitroreductase